MTGTAAALAERLLDDPDDAEAWADGFAVGVTFHVGGRRDARGLHELMADRRAHLLSRLELVFAEEAPACGLAALEQADLGRLRTLRAAFSPVEGAALALLDLLNASIDGAPFRGQCRSQVLVRSASERGWIAGFLREQAPAPEPVFARLNKSALCPEPEAPLPGMSFPSSPDFEAAFPADWDAPRHEEVIAVYARARLWALRRIFAAPITMLGKELFLDPTRFVVEDGRIHVLSRERLGPVHFAGAVFFQPEDFVGVDGTIDALQPLVPPIAFREEGELLHLCCDLFRNAWMVSHRSEAVPVPRIRTEDDVAPDHPEWLLAASLDRDGLIAETADELPRGKRSRQR